MHIRTSTELHRKLDSTSEQIQPGSNAYAYLKEAKLVWGIGRAYDNCLDVSHVYISTCDCNSY